MCDCGRFLVSRGAFRRAILGETQTMGPARWKTILSEDRRFLRSMLTNYYKSPKTHKILLLGQEVPLVVTLAAAKTPPWQHGSFLHKDTELSLYWERVNMSASQNKILLTETKYLLIKK